MERELALLMADLSGYTALTETHGAETAADLIDQYLEVVCKSLVGSSILQERAGDQVFIVAESADDLVATALLLLQQVKSTHRLLQIHGGLHYGSVLKRQQNLFGSSINMVARITSKAEAGSFLCSSELIAALQQPDLFAFRSKGTHDFKNVNGTQEIFELVAHNGYFETVHIDPVCRMIISVQGEHPAHLHHDNLFFCSEHCLQTYLDREETSSP